MHKLSCEFASTFAEVQTSKDLSCLAAKVMFTLDPLIVLETAVTQGRVVKIIANRLTSQSIHWNQVIKPYLANIRSASHVTHTKLTMPSYSFLDTGCHDSSFST